MSTEAQITANQANAQLSTGPVTAEGKAIVSQNALKTGLTGRTVLLPTDDAELYAQHVEDYRTEYNPSGRLETELVQRIADTTWRLNRIPSLEAGLYAVGQAKLAEMHKDLDPERRAIVIATEAFLMYEKQFRNLMTQEARLRRGFEKDVAALREMQAERAKSEGARLAQAAKALITAIKNGQGRSFDPKAIGFEFSIGQIEAAAAQFDPQLLANFQASKPRHLRNVA